MIPRIARLAHMQVVIGPVCFFVSRLKEYYSSRVCVGVFSRALHGALKRSPRRQLGIVCRRLEFRAALLHLAPYHRLQEHREPLLIMLLMGEIR